MRLSVIVIICYIIFTIGLDTALWFMMSHKMRHQYRWPYLIFTLMCWTLLITALAMPWRDTTTSLVPKMWLLYVWISIYIVKLCTVVIGAIGYLPKLLGKPRIQTFSWIGFGLGMVCFGIMWWGATGGRRAIDVREVCIASPRLPQSFEGFRIAQISDLHLGTWGDDTSFVSEFVDSVNAQHPDLIVFTGDIVNRDAAELSPFVPVLSRLKAPYGVISIMGNHDYGIYGEWRTKEQEIENDRNLRAMQREMGWQMLDNSHMTLRRTNDSIIIIGCENWGEPPFPSFGNFPQALTNSFDSGAPLQPYGPEYKILLTHNPEHWVQHVRHESNTDLTMSGHTHAMQAEIRMMGKRWSPAVWRYRTWGGLYRDAGHTPLLYVNVGAGEVGLPFRIGATPEITIFTLTRSGESSPAESVK